MKKFYDRDGATKAINSLLADQSVPWIVLSGSQNCGKTEFAHKVASMNCFSVVCTPKYEVSYACALINALPFADNRTIKDVIIEYANKYEEARNLFTSMGFNYTGEIKHKQINTVIKALVSSDISKGLYTFAHYIGECICQSITCIFLDDLHKCDYDSYAWILEFWTTLPSSQPTVIAICNFELTWESSKLLNTFHGIAAPICIDRFDSEDAFFRILGDHFKFTNDIKLEEVARNLFKLYDGNSRMLFETVKLLERNDEASCDAEKIKLIYDTAHMIHMRSFDGLSKVHLLVLRLLAFSPQPIAKDCLLNILELVEPIATQIINQLYESNLIDQLADRRTGRTLYQIKDDFVEEIIREGCSKNDRQFFETKIFRAIQKKQIAAKTEQTIEIALSLGDELPDELLMQLIAQFEITISPEKFSYYIDEVINSYSVIPDLLVSKEYASLLYQFGYYKSAEKVMNAYLEKRSPSYYDFLLLGDIQHLVLSPKASSTFLYASEMPGISVSDKLKAINRRIMALNQEHQEGYARELYLDVLSQYQNVPCEGLVELYRNTNNSFDYEEAFDYTVKGYLLAQQIDDILECYKCLHNLCMLQLQYGHYGQLINDARLSFIPTFDEVLSFFSKQPEFHHEKAYPLLDLGTAMMMEYALSHDINLVSQAKRYYSQAQLYARSFYARSIVETGLLIANSYLYRTESNSAIQYSRESIYTRYQKGKEENKDYRVHRKILLSLALSAIITDDIPAATTYLSEAHQYVFGGETLRYNRLCRKVGRIDLEIEYVLPSSKYELYYGSTDIVPWLISFGH